MDRSAAAGVVPIFWVWTIFALVAARERLSLPHLMITAFVARIVLVGSPPWLSDDLYRYAWEGLASNHGVDVFSTPPQSVGGLHDALRDRVNHADLTSIYPPFAIAWFRVIAWIHPSAIAFQLATAMVDLTTVFLIRTHAMKANHRMDPATLWALHPLTVTSSALGAHVDVLAVSLGVCAMLMAQRAAWSMAVQATLLGVGVKLFPIVWLGPLWNRLPLRRWLSIGVGLGALAVWAVLPSLAAGVDAFTSLRTYAAHWSFNGLLYPWISPHLGWMTRPLLAGVGVLVVLAAWRRGQRPLDVWLTAGWVFLCTTPTLHPWYGLWLLAPAAMSGSVRGVLIASLLPTSYLILLGYDTASGAWSEPWWLWMATWLPGLAVIRIGREPDNERYGL